MELFNSVWYYIGIVALWVYSSVAVILLAEAYYYFVTRKYYGKSTVGFVLGGAFDGYSDVLIVLILLAGSFVVTFCVVYCLSGVFIALLLSFPKTIIGALLVFFSVFCVRFLMDLKSGNIVIKNNLEGK
jgi:hypothetical protein